MSAPAATAKRDGSATKKRKLEQQQQQQPTNDDDTWDILWPQKNGVLGNPGECTLLLQLDPDDAANLDTEGASGAIGRLEVDGDGVILDMKGRQYHGRIYPGPTALVLGTHFGPVGRPTDAEESQQLRVLGMTDEFCRMTQTGNALDQLSAALEQGDGYEEEEAVTIPNKKETTAKQKPSVKKARGKSTGR